MPPFYTPGEVIPIPAINPDTDGATKMTITLERLSSWSAMWQDLFHRDPIIGCLVVFILLDIASGFIAAVKLGRVASKTSYRGMMSKAQMLLVITAAKFSEFLIPGGPWGNIVAGFFCLTEIISITENAGLAGVPIPKSWMDALQKFRMEENKPMASVEVHTEIHTEKKDVDIVTSQEKVPSTRNKKDKTPSDVIKTVVAMSDSAILSHDDLAVSPNPPQRNPPADPRYPPSNKE